MIIIKKHNPRANHDDCPHPNTPEWTEDPDFIDMEFVDEEEEEEDKK